jgi:oxygen-dependent protoporphyrinogen oxidase
MANNVQALVVGAGISGLSTAFNLQKSGIDVLLIESAVRPGGVIKSVKRDGYLVECGPQSFSGNGYVTALCEDLGILEERVIAHGWRHAYRYPARYRWQEPSTGTR